MSVRTPLRSSGVDHSPLTVGDIMEEYPGAELPLSQLVYALEKRLSLMKNHSL